MEKGALKPERNENEGDKLSQNLYWDQPQPDKYCVRFGTREYTARLWNLPLFADWIKICENTKGKIHGVSLKPSYCESKVRVHEK